MVILPEQFVEVIPAPLGVVGFEPRSPGWVMAGRDLEFFGCRPRVPFPLGVSISLFFPASERVNSVQPFAYIGRQRFELVDLGHASCCQC